MVIKEQSADKITLGDYIQALENDYRFRMLDQKEVQLPEGLEKYVSEKEMEASGYYSGPRFILKERIHNRKDMGSHLIRKADTTLRHLKKAWEVRPQGDEAFEDQLLDALAKAQRLQRELRAVFHEETNSTLESDASFGEDHFD